MDFRKKCPCCGTSFCSDYYEGGYIDHVLNFSKRYHDNYKQGYLKSWYLKELVEDIVFSGNYPRDDIDSKNRLACFMLWDFVDEPFKSKVSETVKEFWYWRDYEKAKQKWIIESIPKKYRSQMETLAGPGTYWPYFRKVIDPNHKKYEGANMKQIELSDLRAFVAAQAQIMARDFGAFNTDVIDGMTRVLKYLESLPEIPEEDEA